MSWRTFYICPIYGNGRALSMGFYAPTLLDAFAEARSRWPGADGWHCVTSVPGHQP